MHLKDEETKKELNSQLQQSLVPDSEVFHYIREKNPFPHRAFASPTSPVQTAVSEHTAALQRPQGLLPPKIAIVNRDTIFQHHELLRISIKNESTYAIIT